MEIDNDGVRKVTAEDILKPGETIKARKLSDAGVEENNKTHNDELYLPKPNMIENHEDGWLSWDMPWV